MDELKQATISQLQDGVTVWFGCDVGQSSDRQLGLMDLDIFEVDKSFGIDFSMSKEIALDYCDTCNGIIRC